MKKMVFPVLMVLFALVCVFALATQVEARGIRIEDLTAYEYDCKIPSTFQPTFSGSMMHIRDYIHVNILESDSPYLQGINTVFADADINLETGATNIRGTMLLEPEAYDGTWKGRWIFIASEHATFGWAVARGTGELRGMTLFMHLFDAPLADDAVERCATVSYNGEAGEPEETFTNVEATILVSSRP